MNAAKILPFHAEFRYAIEVVAFVCVAETTTNCIAMRTFDPLAPMVTLLFGIA